MSGRDRRRFGLRARFVLGVFVASLTLVALRAAKLQIFDHQELTRLAQGEYLADLRLAPRRGQVLDRAGKPLAISVDVPSVYANPSSVRDPRVAARKLAPVLGLDLDSVYQKLASDRLFVWLKRQVTPEVATKVQALALDGIGTSKEPRRFYPNREVAAHVLGFAGLDGHGLEGIEKQFDADLAGEEQVVSALKDGKGNAVLAGHLDPDERTSGADLRLTLDLRIQHAAEAALERGVKASRAKAGMAVVLDVATAELLAMAAVPTFNPNEPTNAGSEARRNRALTDQFEPGSSMKPFVIAAALDARVITPKSTVFCENGSMRITDRTIRDTHSHGTLTLTEVLAKSSNIGAAKIGQLLGRERLAGNLRAVGFGERTGIRFPGESAGLLRSPSQWSPISTATISFGHGIAVNLLQLAAAYRVLAAKGRYLQPEFVQSLERPDGTVVKPPARLERQVFSEANTARVLTMLEQVVSSDGTGELANVAGYRVAGKTGTAQKPDPVAGGYSPDRYVAVFAGFLPVEQPRAVVVVAIDEPYGIHTGGAVAAPVFAELAQSTMHFLGVPPQATQGTLAATPVVADDNEATVVDARNDVSETAARVAAGGMPSFLGMSAREVLDAYAEFGSGLSLEMQGSGVVVQQEPPPGARKNAAGRLRLTLARR